MKNIELNSIKKTKTSKIIFMSFAIMVVSAFSINMIGCSNDSNESKELYQVSLQKRGNAYERGKSVEFFRDAVERINKNPEKLHEIIKEHLNVGSDTFVTQELLNAIQNEIGIVVDLPLTDVNNITNSLFQFFVTGADLDDLIENSNLSPVTKTIFTQVFMSGGVESLSVFEGYDSLSDQDKEFLDLGNYMAGSDAGITTDVDCSIMGVPTDCWMVGGAAGAAIGGLPGAIVGVVIGAALDVISK